MKVSKISAVTIFTRNMKNSCMFYSSIPKFEISYGGPDSNFTTFKISQSPDMYLNIELQQQTISKFGLSVDCSKTHIDKLRLRSGLA